MAHVVLLGDSIFDNAFYVPEGPSVIDHLRRVVPGSCQATLLAVDGARVPSVFDQIKRIPADATHLVLSVGGNDALSAAGNLFARPVSDVRQSLRQVAEVGRDFASQYRSLVVQLSERGLPLTTCTIYDAIPGLDAAEVAGLCVFNDTITRTAFESGATLIDLRLICNEPSDFAAVSPIEPSASGGAKIARAIVQAASDPGNSRRVVV